MNPNEALAEIRGYERGRWCRVCLNTKSHSNDAQGDQIDVYLIPVDDPRGYTLCARLEFGQWIFRAGCRTFSYAEAIVHWGSPSYALRDVSALTLREPYSEIGRRYRDAINAFMDAVNG